MQINLSHRGQHHCGTWRWRHRGVWHPRWARRDGRCTRAVLCTAQINSPSIWPHLPAGNICKASLEDSCTCPTLQSPEERRARPQVSGKQKSLLSAGGWAATQSHHLCLSSAASSLPLCTPHSLCFRFTTQFHLFCRNIYRVQVRKQQLHPHHHRIYLQLGLCGAAT